MEVGMPKIRLWRAGIMEPGYLKKPKLNEICHFLSPSLNTSLPGREARFLPL